MWGKTLLRIRDLPTATELHRQLTTRECSKMSAKLNTIKEVVRGARRTRKMAEMTMKIVKAVAKEAWGVAMRSEAQAAARVEAAR